MKDHEFNTDLRVSLYSSRISPVVIMAPSERATQRMQQERTFRTDLVAITLLIVTVFLLLSLGTYHPSDPPTSLVFPARTAPLNLCGIYGSTAAQTMVHLFGFGAYILVGSMGIATVMLFARIGLEDSGLRITGWFMSFCACCVLQHRVSDQPFCLLPLCNCLAGSLICLLPKRIDSKALVLGHAR